MDPKQTLLREAFKVCTDLIVTKSTPGEKSQVLWFDKGVIHISRPRERSKDSIQIAPISTIDLKEGCDTNRWNQIHRTLNRLIEIGVLK